MRRVLLVCSVLACTPPVLAGLVYDFTTSIETPRASQKARGTVWVRGDCYRAEVQYEGSASIVVSCDADKTATILEPGTRTYRNRARASSDLRSAAIFMWPFPDRSVKGKPKVSYQRGATETIAGEPAVHHTINASFNIMSRFQDAPIRGSYAMTVNIWTAERLTKLPMERPIRTGYPVVDAELEKIAPNIQGMILRSELEVVRRYEGGPPETEKTITIITRLEETDIADSQFAIPEDFKYGADDDHQSLIVML